MVFLTINSLKLYIPTPFLGEASYFGTLKKPWATLTIPFFGALLLGPNVHAMSRSKHMDPRRISERVKMSEKCRGK